MNRETIVEMIRQLQNKKVENGCTEQEALSAARKAGELMEKYNITLDVVYLGEAACATVVIPCSLNRNHVDYCIGSIAKYCDCRVYWTTDGVTRTYNVFGLPIDANMVSYLYDVINMAMDNEVEKFKLTPAYTMLGRHTRVSKRMASVSFLKGMASRIAMRLNEMKEQMNTASTGTGIMVIKNNKVNSEYELMKADLGIKNVKHPIQRVLATAYDAGQEAGNSVNLNRPLAGKSTLAGMLT